VIDFLSAIIAIILCVTFHEFCHAWMANRLGDPTARVFGRLSMNPLRHFDIVGTLSLIFFGIGWGKPVPYNAENLRSPKRDSALIALAGPLSNLLTALVFALPLKYLSDTSFQSLPLYNLVYFIFHFSVVLFALNVLPFPPFDGSKIIGLLVPRRFHHAYEIYLKEGVKYVVIFILFDVFVLENSFHFSVLGSVLGKMVFWIKAIIYAGT
jgi:Zn-dependent protease